MVKALCLYEPTCGLFTIVLRYGARFVSVLDQKSSHYKQELRV